MYRELGANIAQGMDYSAARWRLRQGRYELDGDRVFALVSQLQLTPAAEALRESHRQYLDVQYVARGTKRMGRASLRSDVRVAQAYDARTDAACPTSRATSSRSGKEVRHFRTPRHPRPRSLVEQAAAPQLVREVVVVPPSSDRVIAPFGGVGHLSPHSGTPWLRSCSRHRRHNRE